MRRQGLLLLRQQPLKPQPLAPLPLHTWTTRRGGLVNPFQEKPSPTAAGQLKKAAAPAKPSKKVAVVDPQAAYTTAVRRTIMAIGAAFTFGFGLWFVEGGYACVWMCVCG